MNKVGEADIMEGGGEGDGLEEAELNKKGGKSEKKN